MGEGAHAKHQFQVGDTVSDEALPVADPRLETVEFYKVSNLKDTVREVVEETPPPWRGVPPPLSVYRERGHRRLAARTYEEKCTTWIWGCQMAVEMIIDHWNPSKRRYRTETFCYGPRACAWRIVISPARRHVTMFHALFCFNSRLSASNWMLLILKGPRVR